MSDAGELDGTWDVHRLSGALPPLWGVRKRIEGASGATLLGPLAVPFDVVGLELRYRGPLRGLVDLLEPSTDGYVGRSLLFGRELGRFDLRRRASEQRRAAAI
jgi:hypothetical protein